MPAALYIRHPDITNFPQTFVSIAAQPGDTSLYVQNSTDFAVGNYVLDGVYADPQSEVLAVSSVPNVNTLDVGPLSFPRPLDSPVTVFPFNIIRIYRSVTGVGGTYSLLVSVPFQVDQNLTTYVDYTGVSPYSYQYSFYNSTLNVESDFSSEMPFNGFPFYSLNSIVRRVLTLYVDADGQFINEQSIADWCNELLARLNREVTDSESALFANFSVFTPGTAEYTDMSQYNIEVIHLLEYSSDGGNTYVDTINPMDTRILAPNTTSSYSYRMIADKLFIYGAPGQLNGFPSNYLVRIWYYTEQPILALDGDTLPTVYRSFSDVFVDYCMTRANEQSRRLTESATYFDKKFMDGFRSATDSVRSRLNQGNKTMATTWANSFSDW